MTAPVGATKPAARSVTVELTREEFMTVWNGVATSRDRSREFLERADNDESREFWQEAWDNENAIVKRCISISDSGAFR